MRLILRVLINAAALAAAGWLVPRIVLPLHAIGSLLLIALLFGLVNALIRPVLSLLSCPILLLTLGLFTFVLNAAMLKLTAWLSREFFAIDFRVETWGAALLGALVVSIVSTVLSFLLVHPD